jgi:glycosyltransferase involved in cell wall biosynthesis
MISGYNVADFGVPGIHLIVDFSWDEKVRRASDPSPSGVAGLVYRDNLLRKCYLACARMLQRASGRDPFARDNLFLANSRWTADLMRHHHGVEARVLYPPVAGDFAQRPFGTRENGFVYIGRISPEKRVEDIIAILSQVRSRGHDIHLHVAGGIGTDPYGRRVRRLCLEHRGWVSADGQCSGERKMELLASHRFGINACPREGFGISVAELVKAGSIVFVPCEGGQAEIVAHPMLTFDGLEDAVRKIGTVLSQQELQQELSRHLAERGKAFSTESFMDGMREAVSRFLEEQKASGHPIQ